MTDPAQDFILLGQWFWTVGHTESSLRQHSYEYVDRYLASRDAYRLARGDFPQWEDTSLGLTSKCLKSVFNGILVCNYIPKKFLMSIAMASQVQTPKKQHNAFIVLYCEEPDSQILIILEYTLPDLSTLRMRAHDELLLTADNIYSVNYLQM